MLSPDGRCKTLDSVADGYVRGEACVSALLGASSSPAPAAIVRGSAVNQDGRSSSLTAPNGPSQQAAIASALHAAGVGGKDVGTLQMHGTGTPLGDPLEIGAAQNIFLLEVQPQPLALGALKSVIGHSEAPSGLAGLLQVAVGLHSAHLSPIMHLRSMNPYVSLGGNGQRAAMLPRQPAPLAGGARFAGVSRRAQLNMPNFNSTKYAPPSWGIGRSCTPPRSPLGWLPLPSLVGTGWRACPHRVWAASKVKSCLLL